MELQINSEGVHYLLGVPLNDKPGVFPHVVLYPGELNWLPPDLTVTAFSTIGEAQRALGELRDQLPRAALVYQAVITRLNAEAEKG